MKRANSCSASCSDRPRAAASVLATSDSREAQIAASSAAPDEAAPAAEDAAATPPGRALAAAAAAGAAAGRFAKAVESGSASAPPHRDAAVFLFPVAARGFFLG